MIYIFLCFSTLFSINLKSINKWSCHRSSNSPINLTTWLRNAALSEMFPAGCRVQVLTCRRPLFQAASPPWLPAFSSAAWLALAPTRSPTIPAMFGSPSVGIYTWFFCCLFFFCKIQSWSVSLSPRSCLTATSGALTGVMGKRFYGSRKFMPAGLMAGARYFPVTWLRCQLRNSSLASL